MSRPGIEPLTSRSPEWTLYQLSYRGRCVSWREAKFEIKIIILLQLTGLWKKIAQRKRIMVEPRAGRKEVFDDMMKAFYRVVEGETSFDMSEEDEGMYFWAVTVASHIHVFLQTQSGGFMGIALNLGDFFKEGGEVLLKSISVCVMDVYYICVAAVLVMVGVRIYIIDCLYIVRS